MCEPVRRAVIALVSLAVAPTVAAQTAPHAAGTAALRDTALTIASEAEHAERIHRMQEARRVARLLREADLDTVRVGPLEVITPSYQAARTERIWAEVWDSLAPHVPFAEPGLSRTPFLFQWSARPRDIPGRSERTEQIRMPEWFGEDVVRTAVRQAVLREVVETFPDDARAWLRRTSLSFRSDEAGWEAIHRAIATSSSTAARRCREGDPDACWLALESVPVDDPWTAWYDAEGRRASALRRARTGDRARDCRAGSDSACLVILRERGGPASPLPHHAKSALMAIAIERGGPGALRRFVAPDSASPRARLQAASGLAGDSLVHLWRARVLEARPAGVVPPGRVRVSVLAWILLLGFLSTRSTRWR